jgi:hypothetical protein
MRFPPAFVLALLFSASANAAVYTRAELVEAPVSVDLGEGAKVSLQASIWKDQMPKVSTPGVTLRRPGYQIRLTLGAGVSRPSPQAATERVIVRPVWVYLVHESEVWGRSLIGVERVDTEAYLVRNGPAWPTGISVEVVVRFVDRDGKEHLVRSGPVSAEAVY